MSSKLPYVVLINELDLICSANPFKTFLKIIELIDAPYVNFVLASASENSLKEFNNNYRQDLEKEHAENFSNLFPEFPESSLDFLSVNIQHLVFDIDEQDVEGIKLLLQMPYYHGMIKEMVEVKFV